MKPLRSLFHLQNFDFKLPTERCNREYYYSKGLRNQCMCDFCFDKEEYRSQFIRRSE